MKSDKKFKRKCVACGEFKEKANLIKITKTSDNQVILNPSNKEHGRSIYICKNQECIKQAIKNKRINGALKTQIPPEIIETITKYRKEK